jgi:fluoride exporter
MMVNYLWIALGGALGSMARFWCADAVARKFGGAFPIGTLFVNVAGSFIIGIFAGLITPEGRWDAPVSVRLFFVTGICGGYTTFSTFSLQTLDLARRGAWGYAMLNAALSVGACMVAVWMGYFLGLTLSGKNR